MVAIAVMLVGKLVHLGQVCTDCCSGDHCQIMTPKSEAVETCPFGCQHHSPDEQNPEGEEQNSRGNGHDAHQCAVCSVLSHATQCPAIVGLPDESDLVAELMMAPRDLAIQEAIFRANPRGPPVRV